MKLCVFKSPSEQSFTYPDHDFTPKVIYQDNTASLKIRTMSLPELVSTRDNWLVPEGWPGIRNTLAASYATDPEGFYLLEKDGEKIASISVVTYPAINFAYIGFYVVTKTFRGQGYGKLLINEAIKYSMQKRHISTFGLNCIESAESMYKKYGFQVQTVDDFWKFTQVKTDGGFEKQQFNILDNITPNLLTDIIDYDAAVLGTNRREFMNNFLFKPGTSTVISVSDDKISGYGVISDREPAVPEPNRSYKLGPLYAEDQTIAKQLLSALLIVPNIDESVYMETPGNNQAAAALAESLGFTKYFQQAKMFLGKPPEFVVPKIFVYSSIAIGG